MLVFDWVIYVFLFLFLYLEIFLLLTFLERKGRNTKKNNIIKKYPNVSIVVPCYNEEKTIGGTLDSLLKLDYPKNKLSILVVDDGSTDKTYSIAKKYEKYNNVKIFHKENGGKHTAMNFALEKIHSEFIGCLDADSFVEKDALNEIILEFQRNPKAVSATPSIHITNKDNILGKVQHIEYLISVFIRFVFAKGDSIFITPGPFSFFKTDIIKKLGGWKKAYNTEDMEMGIRLQKNHLQILNTPRAIVYTKAPITLKTLYKQRVRWVYGFLRNIWDYRDMFFNKEYGVLGYLILPTSVLSIIFVIYLFGFFIFNLLNSFMEFIVKYSIMSFKFNLSIPDTFFIDTSFLFFITILMIFITLVLIILGKKMSNRGKYFDIDVIYYFSIYGFIAPLWITSSFVKAIIKSDTKWR